MRSMSHTLFWPLLKLEWAETSSWLPKSFTKLCCCSKQRSCMPGVDGVHTLLPVSDMDQEMH